MCALVCVTSGCLCTVIYNGSSHCGCARTPWTYLCSGCAHMSQVWGCVHEKLCGLAEPQTQWWVPPPPVPPSQNDNDRPSYGHRRCSLLPLPRKRASSRICMWLMGSWGESTKVHCAKEVVGEGRQHRTVLDGILSHLCKERFEREVHSLSVHTSKDLNSGLGWCRFC